MTRLKPWTTSTPGPALEVRLNALAAKLGPYPHAALEPERPRSQPRPGSRLRLWECQCAPPQKVRAATDDLSATCGRCGAAFSRR